MLAHQGGWDEILMVIGPMIVIGGILAVARRRVVGSDPPATDSSTERSDTSPAGPAREG